MFYGGDVYEWLNKDIRVIQFWDNVCHRLTVNRRIERIYDLRTASLSNDDFVQVINDLRRSIETKCERISRVSGSWESLKLRGKG